MRFGLIGAGNIGALRAKALQNAEGCEFAAIADIDTDRAKALAPSSGTRVYSDYREMIASDEVDAVVVSTPPQFHTEMVIASLEAGKHVLCEKPLSNNLEDSRRMVEASRQSGCALATGFNFRYTPPVQFMKETLESGAIGELDHVRAFAGHVGLSEFSAPWEYDKKIMGGGAFMDIGIHMIDLVHYMLGDVTEVYGVATDNIWHLNGSEDNGMALMRNSQGKVASLHSTWAEWKGYKFQIEAYGNKGMVQASYGPMGNMAIYMDEPGGKSTRKVNRYLKNIINDKLKGWQNSVELSVRAELSDFVKFTDGNKGPIASGFDGFRAVEIADAIYRSSDERKPITLVEPF